VAEKLEPPAGVEPATTDYESYTGKNPTYSSILQRGKLGVADRIFQPLKAIVGVIPDYKRNALLHCLRGIHK
jgi:hypothetical protein